MEPEAVVPEAVGVEPAVGLGTGEGGLLEVGVVLEEGGDLEVGVVCGDVVLEDFLLFCMIRAFSSTLFLMALSELLIVSSSLWTVCSLCPGSCPVRMILDAVEHAYHSKATHPSILLTYVKRLPQGLLWTLVRRCLVGCLRGCLLTRVVTRHLLHPLLILCHSQNVVHNLLDQSFTPELSWEMVTHSFAGHLVDIRVARRIRLILEPIHIDGLGLASPRQG